MLLCMKSIMRVEILGLFLGLFYIQNQCIEECTRRWNSLTELNLRRDLKLVSNHCQSTLKSLKDITEILQMNNA